MTASVLHRTPSVVMLCGIAGAGKTTYATTLEARGYVRLSIDEEIWQRFGRYGIDYPPEAYAAHSEAAEAHLRERLMQLVRAGSDCVLDMSFWRRATRDAYRALIREAGGRATLVHLRADRELLRARLAQRRARFDADAAFPIADAQLDAFIAAFEAPHDEGETVIEQDAPAAGRGPTIDAACRAHD